MTGETNLILQYIIVGMILGGVSVWIIIRLIRIRRHGLKNPCAGCSLSESCGKKGFHENNSSKTTSNGND